MMEWLFLFLFIALISGAISFGGFIVGATILVVFKIIFYIFLFLFIVRLIKYLFADTPQVDNVEQRRDNYRPNDRNSHNPSNQNNQNDRFNDRR